MEAALPANAPARARSRSARPAAGRPARAARRGRARRGREASRRLPRPAPQVLAPARGAPARGALRGARRRAPHGAPDRRAPRSPPSTRSLRAAPPAPWEKRGAAQAPRPWRRGSAQLRPPGRAARPDRTFRRRPPDGWRPWRSLSSVERAQDPFEREDHRLPADALAVPGEAVGLGAHLAAPRPGEADHADGLFRRPARRSRHPRDRQRHRGLAALERAARHLARRFLAYGAMGTQRFGTYSEKLLLRGV